MKKLLLAGLVLALVGCGGEPEAEQTAITEDQENTVSDMHIAEVKEPVDYMSINPQDIKNYINQLDTEVSRVKNISLDDLNSVAQQSKKMIELRDVGYAYGTTVFDEPYGRCYVIGIDALDYWQQWHGGDNNFANDALTRYEDNKKACLEAVAKVENGEYKP